MIDSWITWLLDSVTSIDPWLRILLAGVAIMLETSVLLGMVMPGDTVVIVAATGTQDAAQWAFLVVAVVAGALVGESIGYVIGHLIGPGIERWLTRWPKALAQWSRAEAYVRRRGGIAILLSRFLPVLHSLVPLIVGTSGMAYRRFIAWTLPACLVWALAYASVGWLAAGSYRELADRLHGAGYVFVGIMAVFLVVVWGVKRILHRVEARHMRDEDAPGA